MIKTVLLTGATGFIGCHLLDRLLSEGYDVIILKRTTSDIWRIESLIDKVKSYDVDKVSLEEVFEDNPIDCVIHLATLYRKKDEGVDVNTMINSNITFPTRLLEIMSSKGIRFFLNAGTLFEYSLGEVPISEGAVPKPYNLYAATKVAFSDILKYYSWKRRICSVDLKLFSPYGPKDNDKLVIFLVKNFLENKKFRMSPSEQSWNWTYVKDIVEAFIQSVHFVEKMDADYELFEIGRADKHSIKEIITNIEKITGVSGLVTYDRPYPESEIFHASCINRKAKELLGWEPKYDLFEGLKETFDYYKGEKDGVKN